MTRSRLTQVALFLLRVVAGLLLFQPGALKLFGWFGGMPGHPGMGATPMTEPWFAGVLEVIGGPLIMLGLFTRPVAFILSGEMAVAYWQAHFPHGAWPILNHGEPAVLLCFIFLYLAAEGGGEFSLDALIRRARHRPPHGPAL